MRNSLLLIALLAAFCFSCNSKKDKFNGIWMAYKVENMQLDNLTGSYKGMMISDFRGEGHQLDSFLDIEENRLLCFQKDGSLFDDAESFGQNKGSWALSSDEKQLKVKSVKGNETFDIIKIKEKAIIARKQFRHSKDSVLYTFVPFENDKAADMKKCFEYLMNKPSQPESDEQIKTRLRNALKFYSYYFHIINEDLQVNSFKPKRIFLPINYYSGGIGIKPFDANADWVYLFYNNQDAAKAYEHLILALKKVGVFPNRSNRFALEYAEIFNEMSENL